jgi:hypothetical protein
LALWRSRIPALGVCAGRVSQTARRRKAQAVPINGHAQLSGLIFHHNGKRLGEFPRKAWQRACIVTGLGTRTCPKCGSSGPEFFCRRRRPPNEISHADGSSHSLLVRQKVAFQRISDDAQGRFQTVTDCYTLGSREASKCGAIEVVVARQNVSRRANGAGSAY